MKRVRFTQDYGYWAKEGDVRDISDERARLLSKRPLDVDKTVDTGKIVRCDGIVVIIKDLGKHFGHSKYSYNKNGRSEAFS